MSTETDSLRLTMHEICRNAMDAVSNQPGDTPARTASRRRAAFDTISSMFPNNPTEAMLAGQCVMFDHVIRDATGDLLRGQTEDIKLRARPQICGAGRMFLAHLAKFEQLQARAEAKLGVLTQASQAETEAAPSAVEAPATEPAVPESVPEPAPAVSASERAPEPASISASEPARASASGPAPEPASEPDHVSTSEPPQDPALSEPAQHPAQDPARDEAAEPARDQPKPDFPEAARRELASILARHGPTRADIDDALIAACRNLPLHDQAQDRGGISATSAPDDMTQAKRTKELV